MISLVGYTGFVGANLALARRFDGLYNSQNIAAAFGSRPELLIYAGVRAEKFLANAAPEKDRAAIDEAWQNIVNIAPQKLVLISTVDVYPAPREVDEDTPINPQELAPYGRHRYELERRVGEKFPSALIVRLPALFGVNLKKNFLFDLKNPVPARLNENKFAELAAAEPRLTDFYDRDGAFYKLRVRAAELSAIFTRLNFSAVNFTDSRAVFQFYHLAHLWQDIERALSAGRSLQNIATEPLAAREIYDYHNEIAPPAQIPRYDFRTKFSASGYLYDRAAVLAEIQEFLRT